MKKPSVQKALQAKLFLETEFNAKLQRIEKSPVATEEKIKALIELQTEWEEKRDNFNENVIEPIAEYLRNTFGKTEEFLGELAEETIASVRENLYPDGDIEGAIDITIYNLK